MAKRIVIDLDKCMAWGDESRATCSYLYHPGNNGVAWLRELAAYEVICRQCEQRSCIEACPTEALEQLDNGMLKRHNLRCIGCQSCVVACPFGTLVPAAFLFRGTMCDFCQGRGVEVPTCAETCSDDAIVYEDVTEGPDVHLIGDHLAVRARKWLKKEPVAVKGK